MAFSFPKTEEHILRLWKSNNVFQKSLERRKKSPSFVFYEGPPTANGSPGIHHVLGRAYKDIICRFKTMQGFYVRRRAGWDTHGLPVELEVERELGLKSKQDIEKYGIAKFNKACKASVFKYKKEWEDLTDRIAFWIDLQDSYITYETEYMESLWWVIKQFADRKLLYKDYKVVPYCPRCETPISFHEVAQGYETVKEPSVYVAFKVRGKNMHLLAWTTTPWTLPGNVALAVDPDLDYVVAKKDGKTYVVAESRASEVLGEYHKIRKEKGKKLIGLRYEPAFSFGTPEEGKKVWEVVAADFVSSKEGTGIVHTAVAYGADDFELGKKENLAMLHLVNEQGKFIESVTPWKGTFVKDADPLIIQDLEKRGLLFKEEMYEHEYPFCWRCATPLLYYAKEGWFVNVQKDRTKLIANNKTINWVPSHMKEGRFGEWLREVKDWAFSRERYWGTPLPVWECKECKEYEVIGSRDDLSSKQSSKNTYYVMRHGHSKVQETNINVSWPEKVKFHLTAKGKKDVAREAKKLKDKGIDMIFTSDLTRTKETAEIIGKELGVKPIIEKALRERNAGIFNGKSYDDSRAYYHEEGNTSFEYFQARLTKRVPKGDTYRDIKEKTYSLLKSLEKKYQGKTILLISHGIPIVMMEVAAKGLTDKETYDYRYKKKIKPSEWRKLEFKSFPYNEDMELDLHRPYIDDVVLACSKCKGEMKRVNEVVDVWFDSGAMPFAQYHYPFENENLIDKKEQFPADYISEAIDQTRGWFYTLLAVSTLLGRGTPFKNVISPAHVLDEKGQKMSKSKGNIVNPWDMLKLYGSDAIRWYFYTVNNPADPKLFSEKDIALVVRKFLLPLYNSYVFYETYAKPGKSTKSSNVLDVWILSRLNSVVKDTTTQLENYDVTGAARAIESFVLDDLSLWYIRRSRRRFQNPSSEVDLKQASNTLRKVLLDVSKLSAPFIPFLSEHIYGELNGEMESVHLEDWSKTKTALQRKKLEEDMIVVRSIVQQALAERASEGIRVRQPLQKLSVKGKKLDTALASLIAEEVNVKKVIFSSSLKADVELDTEITPGLRAEGQLREIVRHIQEMRRKAGYKPSDRIRLRYAGDETLQKLITANAKQITQLAGTSDIKAGDRPKQVFDVEQDFLLENMKLWMGIRKL